MRNLLSNSTQTKTPQIRTLVNFHQSLKKNTTKTFVKEKMKKIKEIQWNKTKRINLSNKINRGTNRIMKRRKTIGFNL